MDPTIIDLTTKAMAVLLPFVSKGAEEFATQVGDTAYEKAKALLSTIKQKWSRDKEATETLVRFEEKPERYKTVMEDILQASTRIYAIKLLSLIARLIPRKPEIGITFSEAFTWVDSFSKG